MSYALSINCSAYIHLAIYISLIKYNIQVSVATIYMYVANLNLQCANTF